MKRVRVNAFLELEQERKKKWEIKNTSLKIPTYNYSRVSLYFTFSRPAIGFSLRLFLVLLFSSIHGKTWELDFPFQSYNAQRKVLRVGKINK